MQACGCLVVGLCFLLILLLGAGALLPAAAAAGGRRLLRAASLLALPRRRLLEKKRGVATGAVNMLPCFARKEQDEEQKRGKVPPVQEQQGRASRRLRWRQFSQTCMPSGAATEHTPPRPDLLRRLHLLLDAVVAGLADTLLVLVVVVGCAEEKRTKT